jgi:hypothetical protein
MGRQAGRLGIPELDNQPKSASNEILTVSGIYRENCGYSYNWGYRLKVMILSFGAFKVYQPETKVRPRDTTTQESKEQEGKRPIHLFTQ